MTCGESLLLTCREVSQSGVFNPGPTAPRRRWWVSEGQSSSFKPVECGRTYPGIYKLSIHASTSAFFTSRHPNREPTATQQPGIWNMRQATACKQCRIPKRKCIREGSDRVCTPCRQRNLTCGSTDTQRRELRHSHRAGSRRAISPSHNEGAADNVDRLSQAEFLGLVEIYLTKIHGQAHSIFHPPTLRRQLRNNSVPKALLYSMCAIGSKFSPDPQHGEIGRHLALEAKRLLQADMENICLENIQACVLVSMLGAGNCHISSEALFIGKKQPPLESSTTCSTSTHRDTCQRHGDEHGSYNEARFSR